MKILADTYYFLRPAELTEKLREKRIISEKRLPKVEIIITESQLTKLEKIFIMKINQILEKVKKILDETRRKKEKITNIIIKLGNEADATVFLIALKAYLGKDISDLLDLKKRHKAKHKFSRKDLRKLTQKISKDVGKPVYIRGGIETLSTPIRSKIKRVLEEYLRKKCINFSVRSPEEKKEELRKFLKNIKENICKKKCGRQPDSEDVELAYQFTRIARGLENSKILTQDKKDECLTCIINHVTPNLKL